jgi:chorismate mutase
MEYPKKVWRTLTGDWLKREMTPSEKLHYAERRIAELKAEVERCHGIIRTEVEMTQLGNLRKRAETAEAAWNTTETALRTLIDECTNETGEWSRMPRFWVIKKARATLTDGEDG